MTPQARSPSSGQRRRRNSATLGARYETLAAWLLRLKGYRILERRFRAGAGEIDLIATRGRLVVFVEVKARRRMGDALAAITPDKQRRIASAAAVWLARRPEFAGRTVRLDAVMVSELSWRALRQGALETPRHLPDIAPLPLLY